MVPALVVMTDVQRRFSNFSKCFNLEHKAMAWVKAGVCHTTLLLLIMIAVCHRLGVLPSPRGFPIHSRALCIRQTIQPNRAPDSTNTIAVFRSRVAVEGMGQQDGFYHDHYDPEDVNHALFQDVLESHIGEDGDIWIFGFGSLVHTPGFEYSEVVKGYIKGFKRVWWQGSTDHRGTVERPGRTVTLIKDDDNVTYGVAYKLDGDLEQQKETLKYLEWREKQYDHREYVDVYARVEDDEPVLREVLCYIATDNTEANPNYLGPASMDELAMQIAGAVGPSGPNSEYLFKMEEALQHVRESDQDLFVLADRVRSLLEEK